MSTHVIEVDPFDSVSLFKAELKFRLLQKQFERNVNRFIHELGEIGRDTAEQWYGDTITVTLEEIPNGVAINANGRHVVFLEFGAGDAVNESNMYAATVEQEGGFEIRPGSYSEINAHQYELTGRWTFGGIVYTEVQPRNAMEHVYETLQQEMRAIAERVFG